MRGLSQLTQDLLVRSAEKLAVSDTDLQTFTYVALPTRHAALTLAARADSVKAVMAVRGIENDPTPNAAVGVSEPLVCHFRRSYRA